MVTTSAVLDQLRGRIVQRAKPLQLILFGSHARGDARPQSDYDLLVVMPDGTHRGGATDTIQEAIRELHVATDIVVTTPGEIARWGNLVGRVFRPALSEGMVLYDTIGERVRGEPVSEVDIADETTRWIRRASDDLEIAQAAFERGRSGVACYLAQQAVEKATKAVLIFRQIDFPFTPNLTELVSLVPDGWQLKDVHIEGGQLNRWAIAGRYPVEDLPDPEEPDASEALAQAHQVVEAVVEDLRARGIADPPTTPGPLRE